MSAQNRGHVILFSLVTLIGEAFAGARSDARTRAITRAVRHVADTVTLPSAMPKIAVRETGILSAETIDVGRMSGIAVSGRGQIVVADGYELRVTVYDQKGKRIQSIGSRGSGPGQFTHISSMGWTGDTLAVLDLSLRRITFIQAADWKVVRSLPWTAQGRPLSLLTGGQSLYAVIGRNEGARRAARGVPGTVGKTVRYFAPASTSLVGDELARIRDTTSDPQGSDCEDNRGTVHILAPLFPARDTRAILPDGRVVVASRNEYRLDIMNPATGVTTTMIRPAVRGRAITDADWSELSKAYADARTASGVLRCLPPFVRPATFPTIRAIATDEQGRIWVESETDRGVGIQVVRSNGTALGEFPLLVDRASLGSWCVRGDRLYVFQESTGGAPEVRIYSVSTN